MGWCIEPDLFHWSVTLPQGIEVNPLNIRLKQILVGMIHQICYRSIRHDQLFGLAIQFYTFEIITLATRLLKEVIDYRITIVGIIIRTLRMEQRKEEIIRI